MKVLFVGESNNIKSCREHKHNFYEIIIITKGDSVIIMDNNKISASEGAVFLIPPGVMHSHFSDDVYSDMFIHIGDFEGSPQTPVSCMDDTGAVKTLGRLLCTAYIQHERNYQAVSDALLNSIYEYIISLSQNESKYEFVQKLKNILTIKMSDPYLNIANESSKLGVSLDYMRHCFKEETGLTPLEYLTKKRIFQAKRYLAQSRYYSIGEIAELCGFVDRYYFSRCFKKLTGVSPKEYRDMKK